MLNKKLNEIGINLFEDLEKMDFKQTKEIKEALDFSRAAFVDYSADNCTIDNSSENDYYTKLIDIELIDIGVAIEDDSLKLYEDDIQKPIVVLPINQISNIHYCYHDDTCDLVFIFCDSFVFNMTFEYIS